MDIISNYLNNNNDEFITTLIHIFFLLFTCSLQPILSIFGFTVYFSIFLLLFVPLYKLYYGHVQFPTSSKTSSHIHISCFAVSLCSNQGDNTFPCLPVDLGALNKFINYMG